MTIEEEFRNLIEKYDDLNRVFVSILTLREDRTDDLETMVKILCELEMRSLIFRSKAHDLRMFLIKRG